MSIGDGEHERQTPIFLAWDRSNRMALTFLTPLLLAGAAFVAAPIVLHLIMRQQPKHYIFPALRFIQQRQDANRRRLRLRHWLLLALRCLAILLLALALARPSVQSANFLGDQEAPVAAAFVFDTSPRMEYRHENRSRLEAAREFATWLLPQLPPESQVAVMDSASLTGSFAVDLGAAKQRIDKLSAVSAAQPYLDVVVSALRIVRDSPLERKEVYLFTDLARAGWPSEAASRLREKLATETNIAIYVIDVGVTEPRDFSLGDLRLSAQTLAQNGRLRIECDLLRAGPGEERSVAVYLLDKNGLPQKKREQSFGWLGGQALPAEFLLGGLEEGFHQGFVRIVGDDPLPADDTRFFTVQVRPAFKVLVAAPAPVEETALSLTQALAPSELRARNEANFDTKVIPFEQLAETPLETFAAVCLLDPPPLSAAAWEKLQSYASQGGGVALFLGRNVGEIKDFENPAARELLPGPLKTRAGSTSDLFLAPQDLQHPVLAGFRARESQVPWSEFPVFRYWQFESLDNGVNVIVPYNNGRPALMEKPVGKGRVLTLSTPVSDGANDPEAWNILPTGFAPWPFFVLANRMFDYLVGSAEDRFNFLAGETVVLRTPEGDANRVFTLTTPQGDLIPQTVDDQQRALSISTATAVGNYRLNAGGTQSGVELGFSANLAARETLLDRIAPADLDAALGEKRYRLARNRDELTRDVTLGRVGRELYPLLILLVALILGLEHLLANRFYRRDWRSAAAPRSAVDSFRDTAYAK